MTPLRNSGYVERQDDVSDERTFSFDIDIDNSDQTQYPQNIKENRDLRENKSDFSEGYVKQEFSENAIANSLFKRWQKMGLIDPSVKLTGNALKESEKYLCDQFNEFDSLRDLRKFAKLSLPAPSKPYHAKDVHWADYLIEEYPAAIKNECLPVELLSSANLRNRVGTEIARGNVPPVLAKALKTQKFILGKLRHALATLACISDVRSNDYKSLGRRLTPRG